jgi:Rod binding domain-containing protein
MNNVMLLGGPAVPPELLERSSRTEAVQENRKVQSAKDFESLLVGKLVDSMKETIGDSGLMEEEGSEQMQSLFWMNLSSEISRQGGVGLWRDIYKSIYGATPRQGIAAAGEPTQQVNRAI